MFLSAHFFFSMVIAKLFGFQMDNYAWVAYMIGAFIIDGDYLIAKLLRVHNHRLLITHSPYLLIVFIPLIFISQIKYFYVGLLEHFFLDLFDYGLQLNPFSKKTYGFNLVKIESGKNLRYYLVRYFLTKSMLLLELLLFLTFVFVEIFL